MKRLIIVIAVLIVVAAASAVAYLLFTGPRMFVQPNIRHFQAVMPTTPLNTVPVKDVIEPLPSEEEARTLANPLVATADNIAKGKVYYGFYCAFCHGDNADGFGPVGFSYVPVPADLRTAKVRSMSDGRLLYSMLTGPGHSPVIQRIVPGEYRWYLVLYIRRLAAESQPGLPSAAGNQPSP